MQTQTKSHRKTVIKAELGFWAFLARCRENIAVILAAVIGVVLLATGITVTAAFLSGPSVPSAAHSAAAAPSHRTPKHALPHSEHAVPTPATTPGTHLAKHHRDYVIVRPGESLWTIAGKYLHNPYLWSSLWEKNQATVPNPRILTVGQRIYL